MSEECPDVLTACGDESLYGYWRRNFEKLEQIAPEDGWCGANKIKWIIQGKEIGKDRNLCTCVFDDYRWESETRSCANPSSKRSR